MSIALNKRKYLTPEKKSIVLSVAEIINRVCGTGQKEAFLIAKKACVFHAPRRYAGGKTVTKGYL